MRRKAVFGALLLQKLRERTAGVFSTVVGLKPLDACAMLSVGPR